MVRHNCHEISISTHSSLVMQLFFNRKKTVNIAQQLANISMFTVFFLLKKELYNKRMMCGDGYSMAFTPLQVFSVFCFAYRLGFALILKNIEKYKSRFLPFISLKRKTSKIKLCISIQGNSVPMVLHKCLVLFCQFFSLTK